MNIVSDGQNDDRDEFDDVARLRSIARTVGPEDFVRQPPAPGLWERINAEIGGDVPAQGRSGRQRWRWSLVAAAAAVAVVTFGATTALLNRDNTETVSSSVLSNEGLSPRGAATTANAELKRDGTNFELEVELDDAPTLSNSYLELWIIDRNVAAMVSLGPFRGSGRYLIPAGVDPGVYPIVDISIEPADGVPTHSGESVVRGTLG
jgi:anti-sigma-K factor RskA